MHHKYKLNLKKGFFAQIDTGVNCLPQVNLSSCKTILSNLVAEQQLLDQYLQSIPVRNWNTKTTL
jgi:hypothetical protein